jgi:hypothetical protein
MFYTRKTLLKTLEWKDKPFVVDAHAMKDCGIQIVHVNRLLQDVVAEVVGDAIFYTASDSTSCHPHGKAFGMMVAPVVVLGESALAIDRSSKFASPHDKCRIEQALLLEILNQGAASLVDVTALGWQIVGNVPVLVPSAMQYLDDSDAPFHHPSG